MRSTFIYNQLIAMGNARHSGPFGDKVTPWLTVDDWARLLRWSNRKTLYWLEIAVDKRQFTWRYHPQRHGTYTTRQYAMARFAK